eukprot:scaffold240674_cov31-Tisochrysis_lutea.AAC.3
MVRRGSAQREGRVGWDLTPLMPGSVGARDCDDGLLALLMAQPGSRRERRRTKHIALAKTQDLQTYNHTYVPNDGGD